MHRSKRCVYRILSFLKHNMRPTTFLNIQNMMSKVSNSLISLLIRVWKFFEEPITTLTRIIYRFIICSVFMSLFRGRLYWTIIFFRFYNSTWGSFKVNIAHMPFVFKRLFLRIILFKIFEGARVKIFILTLLVLGLL